MMIGQRSENERQRKAQKSKIYKQMLDNQILINQRYKTQQHNKSKYYDQHHLATENSQMPVEQRRAEYSNIDNSFVSNMSNSREHIKAINLPPLHDKNTYYRGSSKFIVVEDSVVPFMKKKTIKTQFIQEEDQLDDQYNSTCQKIIKQLQSINKKPKMKLRRRLYDQTEIGAHSKHQRPNQRQKSSYSFDKNETKNNFDYSIPKLKEKSQQSIPLIKFQAEKRVTSEIRAASHNKNPIGLPKTSAKDQNYKQPLNEFQQYNSPIEGISKHNQQPISQQSTKKQIGNTTNKDLFNPPKQTLKDKDKTNLATDKEHKNKMALDIEKQRQNFVQLLRKVKNRGQSLYVKLAKFPSKPAQK